MGTGNLPQKSRNILKTSNKYQDKIILLTFFPSIVIFFSFIGIVFIGNPMISKALLHSSPEGVQKLASQFSVLIIILMVTALLVSLICSFIISNNMIGAFGRVIREMDEIIAGRSQKMITSRPDDTLTKDMLKRINVFIKYYVEKKNEK